MASNDPDERAREKLQELVDSIEALLEGASASFMDEPTHDQLARMHDVVEAWLEGKSSLSRDQMIAEVSALTDGLSVTGRVLLSDGSETRH